MNVLRLLAVLLLLLNGTGAIFGGWSLITDPSGGDIGLPLSYLKASPFHNYVIPGIILFSLIGIFSMVTAASTIFRWRHHEWLMMAQGIFLVGWILVQMILLNHFYYLQFVFGGIGLAFLVIGYYLKNGTT